MRESNKDRPVPEKKEPVKEKKSKTPKKKPKEDDPDDAPPSTSKKAKVESSSTEKKATESKKPSGGSERDVKFAEKDNSFREFRKLCAVIADVASYTGKTEAVREFFQKGTGEGKALDHFICKLNLQIKFDHFDFQKNSKYSSLIFFFFAEILLS